MTNLLLTKFGFGFSKRSVHVARTLMLTDLSMLLEAVPQPTSEDDYKQAIIDDNCLGKRAANTRQISAKQLSQLYGLNPSQVLFRSLLYFWKRDEKARPLLALLCAATRDATLRQSAELVLPLPAGTLVTSEMIEGFIDSHHPGRYSKVTIHSLASRIRSSWTQTGHLIGKANRVRARVEATASAVAYALLIRYLQGGRGLALFDSEYVKMLDCSRETAMELAEQASARGWIVFRRVGNVVEATFPALLTDQEGEWLRE